MFLVSAQPAGCVNGLLVRRWDGETHRGDHGLVSRGAYHLPLSPLRVVLQHTLLPLTYCDLGGVWRCSIETKMDGERERGRERMRADGEQMADE